MLRQADHQFAHRGVALQIDVLVLDAAPEPFDEDVVEHSPPSIHGHRPASADDNAFPFQLTGEGNAGELRALIAVEDFRLAVMAQSL